MRPWRETPCLPSRVRCHATTAGSLLFFGTEGRRPKFYTMCATLHWQLGSSNADRHRFRRCSNVRCSAGSADSRVNSPSAACCRHKCEALHTCAHAFGPVHERQPVLCPRTGLDFNNSASDPEAKRGATRVSTSGRDPRRGRRVCVLRTKQAVSLQEASRSPGFFAARRTAVVHGEEHYEVAWEDGSPLSAALLQHPAAMRRHKANRRARHTCGA